MVKETLFTDPDQRSAVTCFLKASAAIAGIAVGLLACGSLSAKVIADRVAHGQDLDVLSSLPIAISLSPAIYAVMILIAGEAVLRHYRIAAWGLGTFAFVFAVALSAMW
ncbi:hypothetical protein [Petrachloros mirabilis]